MSKIWTKLWMKYVMLDNTFGLSLIITENLKKKLTVLCVCHVSNKLHTYLLTYMF